MITIRSFAFLAVFLPATAQVNGALDEGWVLSVAGQQVRVGADGSFSIPNITTPDQFGENGPGTAPDFTSDDFIRLTGYRSVNGATQYVSSSPFQIKNRITFAIPDSDLTFSDTPLREPEFLRLTAPRTLLRTVGETVQLTATAIFADSTPSLADNPTEDVTPRSDFTVYRSSNAQIATIGKDGLVTSHRDGNVFITAVNSMVSTSVLFRVDSGPLTTLEGFVRFEDGTIPPSADVSVFGLGLRTTSDAAGHFSISNVSTTFSSTLTVRATAAANGKTYIASSAAPVLPQAISDAGILILKERAAGFGPIMLSGMDPEDHNGGEMIGDFMNFVVKNSALHPNPSSILMLGGSGSAVTIAQNAAASFGLTLTQVTGAGITNADLNPQTTTFDAIYMPTTNAEVGGGITDADLILVNARGSDIQAFVSGGGGVAAFAQTTSQGFKWFPLTGLLTTNSVTGNGIEVTQAGSVVLRPSATSVQPFHQAFTGPDGFFGLEVLARELNPPNRALIIGGIPFFTQ